MLHVTFSGCRYWTGQKSSTGRAENNARSTYAIFPKRNYTRNWTRQECDLRQSAAMYTYECMTIIAFYRYYAAYLYTEGKMMISVCVCVCVYYCVITYAYFIQFDSVMRICGRKIYMKRDGQTSGIYNWKLFLVSYAVITG